MIGVSAEQWHEWITDETAHEGLPAPPPHEVQRLFNVSVGRHNLEHGWRYYRDVAAAAERLGQPITRSTRIAELGCGWGRVLRCFTHDSDNLTGFDNSPVAIENAAKVVPTASIIQTETEPPTPFDDGSFDLLYAISVFSHLPEQLHRDWLAEITRIVRPGGVVVLTIVSRQMLVEGVANPAPEFLERYDRGEFVFEARRGQTYGLAAIPESYVRREWPRWLDVHEIMQRREPDQTVVTATVRTTGTTPPRAA